jgi:ubiquinone biosynthesis protein
VARTLNPNLNMWTTAEPVVRQWMERKLGPAGRLEDGFTTLVGAARRLPHLLEEAEKGTAMLTEMASNGGIRLDTRTIEDLARAQGRKNRLARIALMVGAAALVVIAWQLSR